MSVIDESRILSLLKNSDTQKDAFSEIVKAYSEKLYWVIRRMVLTHDDANDVLQNVFVKAWLNIENFKAESLLSTWLYKIAVNESITFLNKQRNHQSISLDDADTYLLSKMESDSYFEGDEMQKQFQKALLTLPEKQRLVFNMKYFDEMKYEQISDVLGTSVGALKASYHHAVQKIKDFLSIQD
jgi:RNA polymerase sigma-70 factor (ECF subfamily)